MGVITYSQELTSAVAPTRMFTAFILDSHNVIPKIVPGVIKSVEFIEGDGGVGSIKQTNSSESSHINYTVHKIDALDMENFYCKYTLIESDIKFEKIDFVVYEVKFVALDNGGCICKMTGEYHSKDSAELKDDVIKQGKDKAIGLYRTIKEYLLANLDACA